MTNADVASLPNEYTGNYKGCIVGFANTGTSVTGVVENGSLKAGGTPYPSNNGSAVGKITGSKNVGSGYASNRINGGAYNGNNGSGYTLSTEMLNTYDRFIDTYIGGDNDNSGYYFDYENDTSSNIVLKRTKDAPITFTLSGSGTANAPYIIDNYQHYKEASTIAGAGNSYKFKITNDIDFTGKHYYALGTLGNALGGDIDGDLHTLSNISFACAENCGLISKNNGYTIEGLNLNNITITSGNSNVGGLVGYNSGIIKGINANNMTITGNSSVGGLVGYNNSGSVNEVVASVTVTTLNNTDNVGGVVGYLNSGSVKSILMTTANIESLPNTYTGNYKGGIVGYAESGTTVEGVVERGYLKAGGTPFNGGGYAVGKLVGIKNIGTGYAGSGVSGYANGNNGTNYTLRDEMLNTYDKVLDTYIGGDNDNSGYYFDYESDSSNNIIIKRTKDTPITFTLAGAGTSADPYLIDSYQHFKEATIRSNGNYTFKITNDIDFTGKHYYSLGTLGNVLGSDINGDMHTLSNISINCAENCGLISTNSHTIEGLNLNNITITSGNSNVGSLVGYNSGTIKGINADNISVTGLSVVGGIVGYNNSGSINEVSAAVTATTLSNNDYVGGITGYLNSGSVTSILMRDANVGSMPNQYTGNYKGGIVGYANTDTSITGVVEQGRLTAGGTPFNGGGYAVGRFVGNKNVGTGYVSNRVVGYAGGNNGTAYTLVLPTTVTYSSTEIDSLTYYDNVGMLDTVIGGDNDSSGYYFQYNNTADSIIVVKAGAASNPSNPSSNPTSGVAVTGGTVGTNPPTCVLEQVIPRSEGIQAVLTCTGTTGVPTIRSQWNVNRNATTNQFSDVGIIKEGTVSGNSKTVRPYWSTSNTISQPHPNDCYYYRFGASDENGNYSYYVTDECYYGFSN